METTELLVVGGGINGAGIARDAAGRGLSVTLVEQDDLAAHTSSASTKLIHGGLRYLEQYAFRLVREALQERERLLSIAPHIAWPLQFVLPHAPDMRPAWMLRLGLFLYDHLGARRRLPGARSLRLDGSGLSAGLAPGLHRGFTYYDCWVEDSRLVVLNAVDAAARGARILTRTRLNRAERQGEAWMAELQQAGGAPVQIRARMLINAAGPWVSGLVHQIGVRTRHQARLVKGSHIVVRRLYAGDHAYILQNADGRIIFTIPYEGRFTLIGTTDKPFTGDPATAAIDAEETAYLLGSLGRWFADVPSAADIVWSYSGVRALYDDGASAASEVTRDYVLDLEAPGGAAPVLSVFGGKITTYRRLAEHALEKLGVKGRSWTAYVPLPGGDMPDADFDTWFAGFRTRHRSLDAALMHRLARAYGTRADDLIANGLGEDLGGGLSKGEVRYLRDHEFARTADDVLWRRSRLGLHVPPGTEVRVTEILETA